MPDHHRLDWKTQSKLNNFEQFQPNFLRERTRTTLTFWLLTLPTMGSSSQWMSSGFYNRLLLLLVIFELSNNRSAPLKKVQRKEEKMKKWTEEHTHTHFLSLSRSFLTRIWWLDERRLKFSKFSSLSKFAKKWLPGFHQHIFYAGRGSGLVVMWGDCCSEGHDFESQHRKLYGHFSYLFAVNCDVCLKRQK